jgi:cell division protein FtsQ
MKGEVLIDDATRRRIDRRRMNRALSAMAVLMVAAGLIGLYVSPLLRVQRVQVAGTNVLDAQQIAELADAHGDSLVASNFGAARERIAALPLVQSVKIERRWPQTLRITVTERTPWGTWLLGDAVYVIDAEGYVLPDVPSPAGGPTIRALDGPGPLQAGDRVDADAVQLTHALLAQVPERLQLGVSTVEWSTGRGLTLKTDAGYEVVIGDSENMDYKLAVWQQIEAQLGRESMDGHVLDLRFGDRPAIQ